MVKQERSDLRNEIEDFLKGERRNLFTLINELRSLRTLDNLHAAESEGKWEKMMKKRTKKQDEKDPTIMDNTDCRAVEVFWEGKTVKAYFTLPPEWRSLSDATKAHFMNVTDLSNSESRVKSIMERADELYEDMKYQELLSGSKIYSTGSSLWKLQV